MKIEVARKRGCYFEGFELIYALEWDNEAYQFNLTGLWKRTSDGTLWMANDSGCSCPTPWENTKELERVFSVDQLKELRRERERENKENRFCYSPGLKQNEWEAFIASAIEVLEELTKEKTR